VRYKIQKKVNTGGWTTARKVALQLQIAMGGGTLDNASLRNQMGQVCVRECARVSARVSRRNAFRA